MNQPNTPTIISILLPTRGRKEMLKRSLESLITTASNPGRLEVLLGLDNDDVDVIEYIKTEIAPFLQEHKVECRAQIFKPLGYTQLHTYVNTLAGASTGEWLFFWNDDAIMDSTGWDDEICKRDGEFKLLAPTDNHEGHPYAIFPIVPRDWFMLMGHLSQNAQNDAWLSHIAYMLNIFERTDIMVTHDRADLTGNNDDATFRARKYMEGNPADPEDFGHSGMQQARVASAYKIAWFLDKIGQSSAWWDDVVAGKQNPFEKMVTAPGVKGAGMFAAKNTSEKEPTLFL